MVLFPKLLLRRQSAAWALACLLTGSLLHHLPVVEAEPQIRVDVRLVQLPVLVTTPNGTPQLDLKQEDFRITEDGLDQPIDVFFPVDSPVHIALVMDTSGSTEQHLPMLKKAAQQFVKHFRKEDQIGVYEIGPQVVRVIEFTSNQGAITSAIKRLDTSSLEGTSTRGAKGATVLDTGKAQGGTLLYDGLRLVGRDFPSDAMRRAIIVFTDSWDNGSLTSFRTLELLTLQSNQFLYVVLPSWELTREEEQTLADIRSYAEKYLPKVEDPSKLPPGQIPAGSSARKRWILILDFSGSRDSDVQKFQDAARTFLRELDPAARVWLFDYWSQIRPIVFPAEGSPIEAESVSADEAITLIENVTFVSTTAYDASEGIVTIRADRVLILSDANDTGIAELQARMRLSPNGILVLHPAEIENPTELKKAVQTVVHDPLASIRLKQTAHIKLLDEMKIRLRRLSEDTGGRLLVIQKPRDLEQVYSMIAREIRSSYLLGYYTKAAPGHHRLDVQTRQASLQAHTRRMVLIR